MLRSTVSRIKSELGIYKRLLQFQQQLNKDEEILMVHQMGKVGSSSVVATLEKHFKQPILHTHFLNKERLDKHIITLKNKGLKLDGHLKIAYLINQKKPELLSKRKWKIITLVREPIARNISAYFQNLDREHIQNCLNQYQRNKIELPEIIDYFFQNYSHDIPLKWLDWEIKEVFGIDVYQSDFIPQKGYQIYRHGSVELLLMRLENLNECWEEAMVNFFKGNYSQSAIQLSQANIGENKGYSQLYKAFRQQVKIPESYIDKMYNSQYASHFYSPDEIDEFREHWLKII